MDCPLLEDFVFSTGDEDFASLRVVPLSVAVAIIVSSYFRERATCHVDHVHNNNYGKDRLNDKHVRDCITMWCEKGAMTRMLELYMKRLK